MQPDPHRFRRTSYFYIFTCRQDGSNAGDPDGRGRLHYQNTLTVNISRLRGKLKEFFSRYLPVVSLIFITLGVFAIVFELFRLGWGIYWISAGLTLLVLILYLVMQAISFQKSRNAEAERKAVTKELNAERMQNRLAQQDIEDYFLLWIHQIKTPITASYLLINESEFDSKAQLQLEITKIKNYAGMASNISLHYDLVNQAVLTEPNLTAIIIEQFLSNALKYTPDNGISGLYLTRIRCGSQSKITV